MKKLILFSILLFFTVQVFSQNNIENDTTVIVNALSYIDKKLHLNLEKVREYILVHFDEDFYIYDKFVKNKKLKLARNRIFLNLSQIGKNKYQFVLKSSSIIEGSFYYKDGEISKFKYVESVE